jgi:hypothetical protein
LEEKAAKLPREFEKKSQNYEIKVKRDLNSKHYPLWISKKCIDMSTSPSKVGGVLEYFQKACPYLPMILINRLMVNCYQVAAMTAQIFFLSKRVFL